MCSCPIRLQDSLIINIWNKTRSILDFLHRDSYQRKIASKSPTVGWKVNYQEMNLVSPGLV